MVCFGLQWHDQRVPLLVLRPKNKAETLTPKQWTLSLFFSLFVCYILIVILFLDVLCVLCILSVHVDSIFCIAIRNFETPWNDPRVYISAGIVENNWNWHQCVFACWSELSETSETYNASLISRSNSLKKWTYIWCIYILLKLWNVLNATSVFPFQLWKSWISWVSRVIVLLSQTWFSKCKLWNCVGGCEPKIQSNEKQAAF